MKTNIHNTLALALTLISCTIFSQTTYTFNYTGTVQTVALPPGNYKAECWGGIGGWHANDVNMQRGKSGYSTGTITLISPTTLYIAVGGAGGTQTNNTVPGGWNGGGNAKYYSYSYNGGGGATHIATVTGVLSSLSSNTSAVLIVAGGGGGGATSQTPGNGGGTSGGNSTRSGCTGGTQTSPGGSSISGGNASFGQGWDGTPTGGSYGAGGGGWYGGGCESGGSGYVGGVTNGVTTMTGQVGYVPNPTTTGHGMVLITELCSISLTASGSNSLAPSICSGQSVTLTTNAVSNYSWSTGNTTSSVVVVSPTTSTVYVLSATSAQSCTATRNISVTVSPGLPVLTVTNTASTLCLGQSAVLTAGGALSYTWSGGSVPVTNGQAFTPSASNVYTVIGGNGCGISTATTAINITPLAVTAITSSSLICAGSTATLTGASSVNGYTWYPIGSSVNPIIVGPIANTIYTVAASDGTCFGTATVAVNTQPVPTISIAGSNTMVCEGAAITLTASGAQSYTWTPGNSTGSVFTDNPTAPTAYQVVGTGSNGCSSQSGYIVVTQPSPTITIAANKTNVCSGDAVNLTAGGANSYNWTNGPATAAYQVNPTMPTTYTVTGTGSNSCTSEGTISINVLIPSVTVAATSSSICSGNTTTLTATGANSYVWTGLSSINGVAVVSPSTTTNYSVTATATAPGLSCPTTTNISITVFNNPSVTIAATKTVVCKTDAALTLTANGAVNYTWSANNATTTTISVNPQTSTTYSITGTDGNGCQGTSSVQIKVNTCNGIGEAIGIDKGIMIYPNPNNGVFEISSEMALTLSLVNELGQQIRTIELNAANAHTVKVEDLSKGVYFIIDKNQTFKVHQKIVIIK